MCVLLLQDMTTMSYLNEPSVLWNLKVRYQTDDIYTYTGSILIAVNPFAPMPHIYGLHMMEQYRGLNLGELSPHVYAIADESYRQMRKEGKSQSILVRAGKAPDCRRSCLPIWLAEQASSAAAVVSRQDQQLCQDTSSVLLTLLNRVPHCTVLAGQRRVGGGQDRDQQAADAVPGLDGRVQGRQRGAGGGRAQRGAAGAGEQPAAGGVWQRQDGAQ